MILLLSIYASNTHVSYLNKCSVPHEGVHIDFVKSLQDISGGDFAVEYIHGSRASRLAHPSSPGSAAVQDVVDGIVGKCNIL